jgi:hypothetical protein
MKWCPYLTQEHSIAVHNELSKEHTFSTLTEHMPQQHRTVADWSVAFVLRKAKEFVPFTEQLIGKVIAEKQHPQQGFRPSQVILRLADNYGKERLEAVAAIALQIGLTRVQQITNLLKNNKDIVTEQSPQTFENTSDIRGQNYYAQGEGTK